MTAETIASFVASLKVNGGWAELPENPTYGAAEIENVPDEGFSWALSKMSYGWEYPTDRKGLVKYFKTEKGAKRNLIETLCRSLLKQTR